MSDADDNPYVIGPSPYDEATLRRMYEDEDKTLHEIADELDRNVSTIADWMDDFGIERRDGGSRRDLIE